MAKVDLDSPFYTVSGKLSKKDDVVYRTRNGKSTKYKMNMPKFLGSDKQLRHQDLVKEANRLVSEEFSSAERKDYWKYLKEPPNIQEDIFNIIEKKGE